MDTRKTFTGHLYVALTRSGIVTFIDNRGVETGEEISLALSDTIQNSDISIIIFSKNYASSPWCLYELLEILECHKTGGQIILPIFYHVSPSDVRCQKNAYEEAFAKHEERFKVMKDQVQKWRAALAQVAGLSGKELMPDDKQPDAEFIEKIVKDVLAKLNRISYEDHLDPGLDEITLRIERVGISSSSSIYVRFRSKSRDRDRSCDCKGSKSCDRGCSCDRKGDRGRNCDRKGYRSRKGSRGRSCDSGREGRSLSRPRSLSRSCSRGCEGRSRSRPCSLSRSRSRGCEGRSLSRPRSLSRSRSLLPAKRMSKGKSKNPKKCSVSRNPIGSQSRCKSLYR